MKKAQHLPGPEKEAEFLDRYNGSRNLVEDTLTAIASTRDTGKIAPSVRQGILSKFERHPVEAVVEGCSIYLEKGYADEGKREGYLFGIIRNTAKETLAKGHQAAARPRPIQGRC